jgi:phosphatidylglycerophosphate synthase
MVFCVAMIKDPSTSVESLVARVVRDLAVAGFGALGLSIVVLSALSLPWAFGVQVLALYLAGSFLILRSLPSSLPGPGSGAANRVTLGRSALVLSIAALALQPDVAAPGLRAAVVLLGAVALLLDGVDGWVARRTGTGTPFGARFDMETDAFLILALSILAWRAGPVGPWIMGIGALRYLFVAAGKVWPVLERELPPSFRRKLVCVVQGIALLVVVAPWIPPTVGRAVGAMALASLVGSFAVDMMWAVLTPFPAVDATGVTTRPAPWRGPHPGVDRAPGTLQSPMMRPTARNYRVRTRINPSWATEATTSPSRVK